LGVVNGVISAALAGAVAGAAVALPLGAIGVLLVQEAVTVGWRPAAAGALGVGLVDTGYSAVAVLAGSSVSRVLTGHERSVQLVGAVLLTGVALHGLLGVRGAIRSAAPAVPSLPVRPVRVLIRFLALTAVNPLTAIYFVALAAGSGATVQGSERAGAFVAGVFLASLIWQLSLVTIGALVGARLGTRVRAVTGLIGHLLVLGYAVRMASGAG
jgi:arginine exporter protein ArgO